jgi:hypothetical protein
MCGASSIGEDPDSTNPVQRELNVRVEQFSRIIREIARVEKVSYVPFYERLREQIAASPRRALTDFRFLPIYRDPFRSFVHRRTSDEMARANGWQFHVDGVHLKSAGRHDTGWPCTGRSGQIKVGGLPPRAAAYDDQRLSRRRRGR